MKHEARGRCAGGVAGTGWAAATLAAALLLSGAPLAASPAVDVPRVLQEAKEDRQRSAQEILRRIGEPGPATIAALRLALLHEEPFFRKRAAAVLGIVGDACPGLMVRLLDDGDPGVRGVAASALVKMAPTSVGHLGALLAQRSPQSEQFRLALDALGRIGGVAAAGHLCDALLRFREGGFRHELAWAALRAMGPEAAVPVARIARYRQLRAGARLALLSYGPEALAAECRGVLADTEVPDREKMDLAAEAELVLGTDPLHGELVRVLGQIAAREDNDAGLRGEATAMLRQMEQRPRKALTADEVKAEESDSKAAASRERWEDEQRRMIKVDEARAARAVEEKRESLQSAASEKQEDLFADHARGPAQGKLDQMKEATERNRHFEKKEAKRIKREWEEYFKRRIREYENRQKLLLP